MTSAWQGYIWHIQQQQQKNNDSSRKRATIFAILTLTLSVQKVFRIRSPSASPFFVLLTADVRERGREIKEEWQTKMEIEQARERETEREIGSARFFLA